MVIMKYFEDIEPVLHGIYRNYHGHVRDRIPNNYSVELVASGRMYFQKGSGERVIFNAPTLRWQFPDVVYNYGSVDDKGWEHYFVTCRGPRAHRLFTQGFCTLSDTDFIPVTRVDLFRGLFTAIQHALLHKTPHPARAIICLEQLLVHAAEEVSGLDLPGKYNEKLDAICTQINMAPGHVTSLQDLAAKVGLSTSRFRKCFAEHTGLPPHQYLLRARLRAAADRLTLTDAPIKRIATDLGLGSPAQFSKAFRTRYGMPPGAYRAAMDPGSPG